MHARILITAIATLSLSVPVLAQVPAASALSGVVTDHDHALLQSVTVTATDARGHSQLFVTGDDGAFRFADLPDGTYVVAAELPGFRTVAVKRVVLAGSRPAPMALSMSTEPFFVSLMVTGSSGKPKATTTRRAPERVSTRATR